MPVMTKCLENCALPAGRRTEGSSMHEADGGTVAKLWGEPFLRFRRAGLQRQRVQLASHLAFQGRIDDLMLLDAGFAAK